MVFWDLGLGTTPAKTTTKSGGRNQVSAETLNRLRCQACPLDKLEASLHHPKMEATGSETPLIYMLGEGPGQTEDEQGVQFVGKSGKLLRGQIPKQYQDKIRWNNSCRCRPTGNATPTRTILECCRLFIVEDIERTKPKAIFGIGGVPLSWITLGAADGIYKWRGRYLPVKVGSHVCWFFPQLHPAGLLRMRRGKGGDVKSEAELTFIRDLKNAFRLVKRLPPAEVIEPRRAPLSPAPILPYPKTLSARPSPPQGPANGPLNGRAIPSPTYRDVYYVTGANSSDLDTVAQYLDWFKEKPSIALDLETCTKEKLRDRQTRPYGREAKILSVAIAAGNTSFAFPLQHKDAGWTSIQLKKIERLFLDFLKNAKGVKVAHHLRFELEWLGYFYGHELVYWGRWGDSLGQAYTLDERRGVLGLDDLTLQHFGFNLKSLFKLDMSNLDNELLEDVLVYNALDALYEHKLYLHQRKLLQEEGLQQVYKMHIPPIQASVLKQLIGNRIDFDLVKALDEKYTTALATLKAKINRSKAVQKFEKVYSKPFNPASAPNVITLFKEILHREECYDEEKGRYSADDDILKKIDLPIGEYIRQFRAIAGNKSKYVDPMNPDGGECVFPDNRSHGCINIFFTRTGRTSAEFPNEQFYPKRDEEFKEIRGEFVAESGCYLVAIDQGQIEARVIQMAAKDKRYGQYLWDRHDVHMDWTERLAYAYPARIGGKKFIKDKDAMKKFRTDVKNQWTFPLFFGASAGSVSRYLSTPWEVVNPLVDIFWEEFSGIKAWQEELEAFYNQHGYVECLTGRRRRAPISHNELINSPVQGSASDITVNAFCRLSKAAHDLGKIQYQARMLIHDELVFHLPKKTFDRDLEFVVDHLLECKHFPWINVPLSVEVSRGPDWYHLESVGTYFSDDPGFNKIRREDCGIN